jgi:hypothetical protein
VNDRILCAPNGSVTFAATVTPSSTDGDSVCAGNAGDCIDTSDLVRYFVMTEL